MENQNNMITNLREEQDMYQEEAAVQSILETKSNYYLEECIRNKCNSSIAQKILQERQRVK